MVCGLVSKLSVARDQGGARHALVLLCMWTTRPHEGRDEFLEERVQGVRLSRMLRSASATCSRQRAKERRPKPALRSLLESVREHHAGLQSLRSMRRIEARRRKA